MTGSIPRMKYHPIAQACFCLAFGGLITATTGCSSDKGDAETPREEPAKDAADHLGVSLTPVQIEKGGISTQAAMQATYVPRAHGFAVVVAHDAIAQSVSEVLTAAAAAQQSKLALARVSGLAQTPGAFSAETFEGAQHQAQADEAAYELARRKLSASWGTQAPWGEDVHNGVLIKAASGQLQLIRVTFPIGTLSGTPRQLTFKSLAAASEAPTLSSKSVWNAPADASIPGQSLFALLSGATLSEGQRLDAWAPAGDTIQGSAIPASAIVIYEGRSWCYVEDTAGHFERRAIDTERAVQDGYFTDVDVKPGDLVVVSGAALLLAREINPDTEAE